jgi:phage/plasmid-like protein (TIGR03299 family)
MGGMAGDPYESQQDVEELNSFTLIGCTDERGDAWHRRDDLMHNGQNHFPGLIPVEVVSQRLFNWMPRRAAVAYLVPYTGSVSLPGQVATTTIDGQLFRVVRTQQDRIGVLRDDNDYDLGVFKSGAMHPPYNVTLIERAERLVGTTLGISGAGCLQKGARAWVEFSMKETFIDSKSGFGYRPNLVSADSMDGSISLTNALTVNATVCLNTLRRNLLEASSAGAITRRKHTSGITGGLEEEREVLGILEQVDREFVADLHKLLETPVTPKQQIELLDIMVPMPDGLSERSRTLAENKRDSIVAIGKSPMVEPWIGTALGEVQRYNTWQHWQAPVKGTGRWERNVWRQIMGKSADADAQVVAALDKVLVASS